MQMNFFLQMIDMAVYSPFTFFQDEHAECRPWDPDPATCGSDDCELLPHVDLHDIQWLAVHSSDPRSSLRLFPLWMAQVRGSGHH